MYWGYGLDKLPSVTSLVSEAIQSNGNHSCDDWDARPPLRLAAELHYGGHALVNVATTMVHLLGPHSQGAGLGAASARRTGAGRL